MATNVFIFKQCARCLTATGVPYGPGKQQFYVQNCLKGHYKVVESVADTGRHFGFQMRAVTTRKNWSAEEFGATV
jgi:hypothetical protein